MVWISSYRCMPATDPLQAAVNLGGNLAGYDYTSTENALVNMVQQGYQWFETYAGGSAVAIDANGDPTADFQMTPHWLDNPNGVGQTCKLQCNGYCASSDITTDNGHITVANWVYTSGTNTTTADVVFDSTWAQGNYHIKFLNTKRTGGSGGTANTGLTNVQMAHPGYTIADIAGKVWTDEAVTYYGTHSALRYMDAQGINSASYTWATAKRRSTTKIGGPTWEDCVDLSNRCNAHCYFQIPHSFAADADAQSAFDMIESRLNPSLKAIFGYSNEHAFSVAFQQFEDILIFTCLELKAFVGGAINGANDRTFTASRTSNVITITTVEDHLLSSGTVYFNALDGMAEGTAVTTTVTGAKTFTFSRTGANGSLTVDSSTYFIGELNSTLRYGSTIGADPQTNLYQLKNRYSMRRLKELSDLCRGRPTIGDAKMMTRWFPVWEDQMVDNSGDEQFGDAPLRYLETKWTSRSVKQYVGGLMGAPYFFCAPYQESAGATQAQVVGALAALMDQPGTTLAKIRYHFESRVATACYYGLALGAGWYEGGPDTKSFTLNTTDLAVRCATQFDPALRPAVEQILNDHFSLGGGLAMWYTLGFLRATDQNRDVVWGLTDHMNNTATPKMQGFANVRASPPIYTRNVVPGTVDARNSCDRFGLSTYTGLTGTNLIKHWRIVVRCRAAGTYTLRIRYTCNFAGVTATVYVNETAVSGSPFTFTDQTSGGGGTHASLRSSPGPIALTDMTVVLKQGPNAIDIARTVGTGSGDDVEPFDFLVF